MGVDYDANYGIGVKLINVDFEKEDMDMYKYIESLEGIEDFEHFEIGDEYETGGETERYICIRKPFENGIEGLQIKFNELYQFLKSNDVKYEGNIDLVGGLHIC